MILIADSGSTKTAWRLVNQTGTQAEITTQGMNPFFRTTDDIAHEIGEKLFPVTGADVSQIWFYGAGVVSAEKGEIVKQALNRFYPEAKIATQSDLLGACTHCWEIRLVLPAFWVPARMPAIMMVTQLQVMFRRWVLFWATKAAAQ